MTINRLVRDVPTDESNGGLVHGPLYGFRARRGDERLVLIYSYVLDVETWWNVSGYDATSDSVYRADYKESELTMPSIKVAA